jgi:hypothetical protein
MKFLRTITATIVACLFLLPACVPQYKKAQLKPLDTKAAQYHETKNGITLNAKVLSPKESAHLLGSQGKNLHTSGITPIQLSIINNSIEIVQFDPTKINAPFAESKNVASVLSQNAGKSIGGILALGGLFTIFTGLGGLVAVGMYGFTGHAIYLLGLLPVTGVLITTSTTSVYYYKKIESLNVALTHDIKAMSQAVSIASGNTLDTVLFLDKTQFNGTFSVSLNAPFSSTTFTIDLQK